MTIMTIERPCIDVNRWAVAGGDLLLTEDDRIFRIVDIDGDDVTVLVDGTLTRTLSGPIDGIARAEGADRLATLDGADIVAILALDRQPHLLNDAWASFSEHGEIEDFAEAVAALLNGVDAGNRHDEDLFVLCNDCDQIDWTEDSYTVDNGANVVCQSCYENGYFTCERCENIVHDDDSHTVDESSWCQACFDYHAYWCEDCDDYFATPHEHEEPGCDCCAPHERFSFPANGAGFVGNDTRLGVELPAGTITREGVNAIYQVVRQALLAELSSQLVFGVVDGIEPVWQAKRGNYTRRLSSALHRQHGVKLPPHTVSEVGNVARQHTSGTAEWWVGFTRDLNRSADAFYHDDSCWWGSFAESRCALKSWGGLGILSYGGPDSYAYSPNGRAWVQPLDENLRPTHDAAGAHAYVVYNGYGELEGYAAARIVAHLTGRTYRKVSLDIGGQYVNNDSGYLVADQATCEANEHLSYGFDIHDQRDAYTVNPIRTEQETAA